MLVSDGTPLRFTGLEGNSLSTTVTVNDVSTYLTPYVLCLAESFTVINASPVLFGVKKSLSVSLAITGVIKPGFVFFETAFPNVTPLDEVLVNTSVNEI